MTDKPDGTLDRIARRVPVPMPAYERLLRRRDRRERNRRVSALVVAIAIALLSVTALTSAFRNAEQPAASPTPAPGGIFAGIGGWIAHGDETGVWAQEPGHPETHIQLSEVPGTPLSWSRDGSELLILRVGGRWDPEAPAARRGWGRALWVLRSDGTETRVFRASASHWLAGASLSPDGSTVVVASEDMKGGGSGIYLVGARGGAPRRILHVSSTLGPPTFSPDGSRIAYFEGEGDSNNTLRVMHVDGSGSRILLPDAGVMRGSAGLGPLEWSPDGRRLAFGMAFGPPYWIYLVNADGSGLTRFARGGDPSWSSDGTRIAYGTGSEGLALAIANLDGSHLEHPLGLEGPWNPAPPG